MHRLHDDARFEDEGAEKVKTCNVLMALEAAMQIQMKKVLVGPNDSVGVLFYNTVCCNVLRIICSLTEVTHLPRLRVMRRVVERN